MDLGKVENLDFGRVSGGKPDGGIVGMVWKTWGYPVRCSRIRRTRSSSRPESTNCADHSPQDPVPLIAERIISIYK